MEFVRTKDNSCWDLWELELLQGLLERIGAFEKHIPDVGFEIKSILTYGLPALWDERCYIRVARWHIIREIYGKGANLDKISEKEKIMRIWTWE